MFIKVIKCRKNEIEIEYNKKEAYLFVRKIYNKKRGSEALIKKFVLEAIRKGLKK